MKNAIEHTQEPWKVDDNEFTAIGNVVDSNNEQVCQTSERKDSIGVKKQLEKRAANARRIVACVNFCKGLSTENMENDTLEDSLKEVFERVRTERDKYKSALLSIIEYADKCDDGDGNIQKIAREVIAK